MIRLYGTIVKDGRFYSSCYFLHSNGWHTPFQLTEKSHEEAFAHLKKLQATINAVHPRRGENGSKAKTTV